MRVLVTGCSGFLGGHLVRDLSASGFTVFGSAYTTTPEYRVKKAATEIIQANIADVTSVYSLLAATNPDVIIHAAALASLDRCEQEPGLAWQVNVQGTETLVGAATSIQPENPPLFIHISTDLVFDDLDAPPGGFLEETVPKAKSVYAKSKRCAEQMVAHYYGQHLTLRTSLICGEEMNNSQGFMRWLRTSLEREEALSLFIDEFRTPVYVHDISRVLAVAMLSWKERNWPYASLYHLGGPERVSRVELGLSIAEAYKLQSETIIECKREDAPGGALRAHDVSLCNHRVLSDFSLEFHSLSAALKRIAAV